MRDPVAPHTFVLDRIFGRIKTEPQISRPSCSAWEAKTMRTEKIAKFDERTIGEANRLASPSTCSPANRGLLVPAASASTSAGSLNVFGAMGSRLT